jgi:hypothetical protein
LGKNSLHDKGTPFPKARKSKKQKKGVFHA